MSVTARRFVPLDDVIARFLAERPGFAAGYLSASFEAVGEPGGRAALMHAVRDVVRFKGEAEVAAAAGLTPAALARMLSDRANPKLGDLLAVLGAVGLRLGVAEAPKPARRRAAKAAPAAAKRSRPTRASATLKKVGTPPQS